MDALELIEAKSAELTTRRAQVLRDLDAIDGALQILDELRKELSNESEIQE
jgi:hypothetical protein